MVAQLSAELTTLASVLGCALLHFAAVLTQVHRLLYRHHVICFHFVCTEKGVPCKFLSCWQLAEEITGANADCVN